MFKIELILFDTFGNFWLIKVTFIGRKSTLKVISDKWVSSIFDQIELDETLCFNSNLLLTIDTREKDTPFIKEKRREEKRIIIYRT